MMNNNELIRQGKGLFLKTMGKKKIYDFSENSNILGHSYKKMTTQVKNYISSSWNISQFTIYHRRIKKLFETLFSDRYQLFTTFSLEEFTARLICHVNSSDSTIRPEGKRYQLWFQNKFNTSVPIDKKNDIIIYDMAENYLLNNKMINPVNKKNKLSVLNYYWYPEIILPAFEADIIILPQIFCGNFHYVNILINKSMTDDFSCCVNPLEAVPSLYIASSLQQYYQIKKAKSALPVITHKNIIQKKRLFTFKNPEQKSREDLINHFKEKNVLFNISPPFYQYLPIILENQEIKKIERILND